ncbi:MAG: hypothetical protein ACFB11_05970, partial [Paracoccaceae bacterium]
GRFTRMQIQMAQEFGNGVASVKRFCAVKLIRQGGSLGSGLPVSAFWLTDTQMAPCTCCLWASDDALER